MMEQILHCFLCNLKLLNIQCNNNYQCSEFFTITEAWIGIIFIIAVICSPMKTCTNHRKCLNLTTRGHHELEVENQTSSNNKQEVKLT